MQEQEGHGEVWCFSAELEPIKSPDIQSFIFTEASQLVQSVTAGDRKCLPAGQLVTKNSFRVWKERITAEKEGRKEGRKEWRSLSLWRTDNRRTAVDMERERRWTSEVEVVWQRAGPSQVTCQWSVFVLPSRGHDGRPTRHIQSEPAVFIAPSVTDVFSDVSDQTSCLLSLFVHSVVLMSRERSSTNRQHTSYCFTVFICGTDPATFPASHSLLDVIFLWEQLVYLNFSLLKLRSAPLTVLCRAQVLVYSCSMQKFYSTEGKCVCTASFKTK